MSQVSLTPALLKFLAKQPETERSWLQSCIQDLLRAQEQGPEAVQAEVAGLASLTADQWALLFEAAARLPEPRLLAALAAGPWPQHEKTVQKAWKRAQHYRLSRQLPSPELPAPASPVAAPLASPPQLISYLSSIAADGSRMAVIEVLAGNFPGNFLTLLGSDTRGLLDGGMHRLSKKLRQQYLQELAAGWPGRLLPMPLAHVLEQLETFYQVNPQADNAGVRTYRLWRSGLLAAVSGQLLPVTGLLPPVLPGDKAENLMEDGGLLKQEEILAWCPGPEELQPWLTEVQAIATSPLVLTKDQISQRFDDLLDRACRALYPPEKRPVLSRRLLEMAYYFFQSGRPLAARQAQLVAAELTRPSTMLTAEPEFLRLLILLPLQLLSGLGDKAREQDQQQGLILTRW